MVAEELVQSVTIITGVETLLDATKKLRPSRNPYMHSLLQDSINGVLEEVLGKDTTQIMYRQLEREFHIDRDKVPEHLGDFFMLLERIYGLKSDVTEKAIARKIWEKLACESKNWD